MRRSTPWRGRGRWAAVTVAVAGIALVPAAHANTLPGQAPDTAPTQAANNGPAAGPTIEELRAKTDDCGTQLSNGLYAEDHGGTPTTPICGKDEAVFWQADLDVDCDGQRTEQCNENTDPYFQPQTACVQSDGAPLNSTTLPHIVIPLPSEIWDHAGANVNCGTVGAVMFEDKIVYGIIGDKGPASITGEGSYGMAEALGINPDPATGGVSGRVVRYVVFPGNEVTRNEDHAEATRLGEEAALRFVGSGAR